jgi:hypothetical protein
MFPGSGCAADAGPGQSPLVPDVQLTDDPTGDPTDASLEALRPATWIDGRKSCSRQESVLASLWAVISVTGHLARRAEIQQFPSGA